MKTENETPSTQEQPQAEARPTILFSPYSNTFSGWGPKLATGSLDVLRNMN
ncbi:MAG: hypothetical protein M3126_12495 [Candidatus Eremiobacteraeota bacterium]|nr:hypothetical protein [Candidatus Eremiobacteraeota bacterium]